MNGENLALQFASWSINTKYDQIPDSVKKCARRAMTDTLGVIVAGSVHTKVVALVNALSSHRGRSSVFKNNRLSATNAATINGMAAHVWDFDDTSYTGVIHGSAIVLPAILAVAENIDASESDLISAFIVGSEVTYTLGEICTHNHFLSGWWSTGSCATIGATAAVCRLLRLDKNQCASAIGTAAVSSGVVRAIAGTDAKPYLAGQAAGQAIEIARAAQAGLTGPLDAFEQENGFFNLLNDGHSSINEASSLGIRWRIQDPGLLFKTSPVCSAAHAAIDEMAKITQNHGRPVEDIVEIVAEIPDLVRKSLVSPKPTNPQEAQFSLPYAIACAALYGRVRLQDLQPDAINEPLKIELMKKIIEVVADDLSTEQMREKYPESARLSVSFKDGSDVQGFCGEAYGMPGRPMSDEDLKGKFADCLSFAGHTLSSSQRYAEELLCSNGKPSVRNILDIVTEIWKSPCSDAMEGKYASA